MDRETARNLIQTILDIAQTAIAAQNRLTALLEVLKEKNPTLHQAYEEQLRRQAPMAGLIPEGFDVLVSKLAQD